MKIKKIAFLFSLLCGMLILSSCGNINNQTKENMKTYNVKSIGLSFLLSENFYANSTNHETETTSNAETTIIFENKVDDANINISRYTTNTKDYIEKYYTYTTASYVDLKTNYKSKNTPNKLIQNLHISEGTYYLDNVERYYKLAVFDIDKYSYAIEIYSKENMNILMIVNEINKINSDYNIESQDEKPLSIKNEDCVYSEVESNLYVFTPYSISTMLEAYYNEGHERYIVFQNETASKQAVILLNDYPFYPTDKENWYFTFGYEKIYSDDEKTIVHNINDDKDYYMNFATKYIYNDTKEKYIQIIYYDKLNQFDIAYWLQQTTDYYNKNEVNSFILKLYLTLEQQEEA